MEEIKLLPPGDKSRYIFYNKKTEPGFVIKHFSVTQDLDPLREKILNEISEAIKEFLNNENG